MTSDKDIYIVFSRKDNDPGDPKSWISNFHRFLEMLLTRLSGRTIKINLAEDTELNLNISYKSTTILIPIVSQGLLRSGSFNEEIKSFHEKAINKEHNNIDWNSRIFKVLRYPIRDHYLLDYLSSSVNYNFFHIDSSTEEVVHYEEYIGQKSEKTFWMRLYDLAYDLHKIIEKIGSADDEIQKINQEINAFPLYLANVGLDLVDQRDELKRELLRHGLKVFPESKLPDDVDAARKMIVRDLAKCKMSVHMIGSDFNQISGTDSSLVELQNQLAIDYFNDLEKMDGPNTMHFGRIIWISPDLGTLSVKQKLFIDNLRKNADSKHDSQILEVGIEELKEFIIGKIFKTGNELNVSINTSQTEHKSIYLICDKKGYRQCEEIKTFLEQMGHEVLLSKFDGNPEEVRLSHSVNLKKCDAALMYCGKNNEEWMRSKFKDILKSLGLGREKPISPQAILVEDEFQLDEIVGLSKEALVIQRSGKDTQEAIEPFLSKLNEQ
jgi:hypothetical protein